MKKIIVLILIFTSGIIYANNAIWHDGSAKTLPEGRIEVGLFQPLRYGLNETLELATFPLADILIPNITVKKFWKYYYGIDFASKHSLIIPTPLLNIIAREGAGGILPANSKIPFILVLNNQVISTYAFSPNLELTGKLGLSLAIVSGRKDFPTIDLPLVYNRTSVYHENNLFNCGLDLRGILYKNIDFLIDYDHFFLPKDYADFCVEHKGLFIWKINRKFALSAGYKLVYSDYPSKKQRNTDVFPLIDFQMGFK